jgi:hypothetical protein
VYGDYYYVAANHRDELDGQNGFWLRRVYFTYDHTLSKAFSLRFRLELNSKGWQDRPDGRDVSTLEAFAGWQEAKWRASLQYGRQERREAAPGGLDLDLEFLSAFAMVQVTPKLAVVGRLDRSFDEVPNGETIDYMPFSETARALFGYAGVDVTLAKTVAL